jgi:hypothetical protein
MLAKATLLAVIGLTRAVLAAPVEVCVQVEQVVYVYDDGSPVPANIKEPSLNILATVQVTPSTSSVVTPSSTTVSPPSSTAPEPVLPTLSSSAPAHILAPSAAPKIAPAAVIPIEKLPNGQFLTVSIVNSMPVPVQTKHAQNPDSSQPVNPAGVAAKEYGSLQPGASDAFVIQTPWGGNVALVEDKPGYTFLGDESLIEISFQPVLDWGVSIDVDISYV